MVVLALFSLNTIQSPYQKAITAGLSALRQQHTNFEVLLYELFSFGDALLNEATAQNYTFYRDVPPDLPEQILKMLDEFEVAQEG